MNSEKLIQAVQLIKSGNKQAALSLLKEIVQADPNNENAWLWLYSCVENTEQKKYCLQQALRINPDNPHAHSALLKLESLMPASPNLSHQSPQRPVRETRHPAPVSTTRAAKPNSSPQKKQGWWLWVSGIAILICVGFSLAGVLLSNVGWFEQIPLFAAATGTSTPTYEPTRTFTPTFSPAPTNTNTPTLTPTSTITNTPTTTYTTTPTPTLVPMSEVAKHTMQVALSYGLLPELKACNQERSCQSYIIEAPYMLVVIKNNGTLLIELEDETTWFTEYVKPDGAKPPYEKKADWYFEILKAFFYNTIDSNRYTAVAVCDLTMTMGSAKWETDYGYTINGLHQQKKIILSIIPPNP